MNRDDVTELHYINLIANVPSIVGVGGRHDYPSIWHPSFAWTKDAGQ